MLDVTELFVIGDADEDGAEVYKCSCGHKPTTIPPYYTSIGTDDAYPYECPKCEGQFILQASFKVLQIE